MSSKSYHLLATFVMAELPGGPSLHEFREPQQIVLVTATRVWIAGCYSQLCHPDVVQVGDGSGEAYDAIGNCVLSLPREWITHWLTDEEAESISLCIQADDQLLSYAN